MERSNERGALKSCKCIELIAWFRRLTARYGDDVLCVMALVVQPRVSKDGPLSVSPMICLDPWYC